MFRERVIDKNIHQITEFASVRNFLDSDPVRPGISTIYEGGLPIDLLIKPTSSTTTIFFFHGAIEPHFTLPVLSGLGISGGLSANRVFVSDPSLVLDEKLTLAWYAGNYRQPKLQEQLTHIFQKILTDLGSHHAVFFGGSGGGFASLYFASHFSSSLALVFNPQTNIAKYRPQAVRAFVEKGFGVETTQANPLGKIPDSVVYDLCSHYKTGTDTTIAYMQNLNDKSHVHSHLIPFFQALPAPDIFLLLTEPWHEGHSPPPKDLLSKMLNLSATSNDWRQSLLNTGFEFP